MTCHLLAVCFDANRPVRLARFWAGVLGWEVADDSPYGIALLPGDDTGFRIRFRPTLEQKSGQNQMHFDLTSTSPEDQQQTVARSLELGARHIDIGQRPEEGHVVLADPEGNEFRVLPPTRQRTCSAPHCNRPAERCDDDHTLPYDQGGRTCECELAPLCRRDHQAKQAQGWRLLQPSPGVLVWELPHDRRYLVTPGVYPTCGCRCCHRTPGDSLVTSPA